MLLKLRMVFPIVGNGSAVTYFRVPRTNFIQIWCLVVVIEC
jgi:hypothetical protein